MGQASTCQSRTLRAHTFSWYPSAVYTDVADGDTRIIGAYEVAMIHKMAERVSHPNCGTRNLVVPRSRIMAITHTSMKRNGEQQRDEEGPEVDPAQQM